MKKVLGICGSIALAVLPASGGQTVTLKVTPEKSFAPASVVIRARNEPSAGQSDADNQRRRRELLPQ